MRVVSHARKQEADCTHKQDCRKATKAALGGAVGSDIHFIIPRHFQNKVREDVSRMSRVGGKEARVCGGASPSALDRSCVPRYRELYIYNWMNTQ